MSSNRVVVGVPESAGAAEELRLRYGDAVLAVLGNPEPTACSGRESCIGPPLRGGISGSPKGTTYRNRCSIAFLIHYYSSVQWLTAGHCAKVVAPAGAPPCPSTNPPAYCWYHAGNGSWAIGQIKKTCWPQCLRSDSARGGNISPTYASNKLYGNHLGEMRNVGGVQSPSSEVEGQIVCLNARRVSGSYRCGYWDHKGRWDYPGGVYFEDMRFATYGHMYGDSGGAVKSGPRPTNDFVAYGVHSGCTNLGSDDVCYGLSIYSHISRVTQELGPGVTVCTTANPCP